MVLKFIENFPNSYHDEMECALNSVRFMAYIEDLVDIAVNHFNRHLKPYCLNLRSATAPSKKKVNYYQ